MQNWSSAINVDNCGYIVFHLAANKPNNVIETLITHIKFKNNDEI